MIHCYHHSSAYRPCWADQLITLPFLFWFVVVFCLVFVFGSGCFFVLFVFFLLASWQLIGLCTGPTSVQFLKPTFMKMDNVFALINWGKSRPTFCDASWGPDWPSKHKLSDSQVLTQATAFLPINSSNMALNFAQHTLHIVEIRGWVVFLQICTGCERFYRIVWLNNGQQTSLAPQVLSHTGKTCRDCSFFLSESVAFRRVYGLESYSRTSGESNHQWQSVSDTSAAIPTEPRGRLKHDVIYPRNQSWADQGDQGVVWCILWELFWSYCCWAAWRQVVWSSDHMAR